MPSRVVNKTGSVTLIPISFDNTVGSYHFKISNGGANITSTNYTELNNAFSDSNNSSCARLYLARSRNNTRQSQAYFDFDKSLVEAIPSNAAITSISCNVRYTLSNTNYITAVSMQLYSGTTDKGTARTSREQYQSGGRLYTITPGTWTRDELQNIRFYISATHNASTNGAYIYFFGADVTINYSYQTTEYEITTTVQSGNTTFSPTSQYVESGLDGVVTINNLTDISTFSLTDNGNNVVSDLVHVSGNTYTYTIENISSDHALIAKTVPAYNVTIRDNSSNITYLNPVSGSVTRVSQGSNFDIRFIPTNINYIDIYDNDSLVNKSVLTTDTPLFNTSSDFIPTSYSGNTFTGNALNLDRGLTDTSSTSYANLTANNTNTNYVVYYQFNTSSIPENSTINSISCSFKIRVSSSFSGTSTGVELYSGNTIKSNRNYSGWYTNTTAEVYQLTGIQSFTREELDDIQLKITGRASNSGRSIYFYGAELIIEYKYLGDTYYIYTVSNVQSTRTIRFEDKTKYNITSSSSMTGVSVSPSSTQVYEGNDITLDLVGITNIQGVILKDNNADVSSQISLPANEYTVTSQVSGASYGFTLNTNNYYESTNSGHGNSAAVCRVNFDFETTCNVTIEYINSGESPNYDYGIFGNIDSSLGTTYTKDSNTFKSCNTDEDNLETPQILVYSIPSGEHFIDIKYRKDQYTNEGNDSLQWKIISIQPTGAINYKYTISNVTGNHILTISEAPHHTITASSTFTGVTISPSGSNKIYQNGYIDFTITSTETTKPGIKLLLDDIIDVTSNISGNNYRFNDDGSDHTLKIVEQPKYTISGTGYNGITVSISTNPVYHGSSTTITVNNVTDISEITIYDNNKAITGRFELEDSSYVYILTNVTTNHTITIGPHVTYNITSTNNTETPITIIPTGTETIDAGDEYVIALITNNVSKIQVLDNDVDTSDNLVYYPAVNSDSLTVIPNKVVEYSGTTSTDYPLSNGLNNSENYNYYNYARISLSQSSGYIVYSFDTSDIPVGAVITSISCRVRARASNNSVNPKTLQLYNGDTPVGNTTNLYGGYYTDDTNNIRTLTDGTWTRDSLQNIRIRIDGTNSSDYNYYLYFYGADLTINYSVPECYKYILRDISTNHTIIFNEILTTVFSKVSNSWSENSKIYEKRNGNWVQVEGDDILTLFDTHKIYIRK